MAKRPIAATLLNNDAESRLADINRLAASDPARATALSVEAKSDGIRAPIVHLMLGLFFKRNGRFEEAIAEFGLGLELDSENIPLLNAVGFCLLELDRRQEAAQVFQVALKIDPNSAEAAYGYGWTAERLGALEQAQSAWERAIALNPGHADALAGLSGLAVRRRDWTTARDLASRAVALEPRQTDAVMNLARVELGIGDFAAAEKRLRTTISLSYLSPVARANARVMLGDALDGQGRYPEALASYTEGKNELRALYAANFDRPGEGSAVDGVRRLLAEFQQTDASAWTAPARPPEWTREAGHAFLLGFPRSGTTLLEQVLATHPDVVTLEERPALLKAEVEFLTQIGGVRRLASVVPDFLTTYREDYWRRVGEFGVDVQGKVFVDKQPLNTFRLPLISKLFPNAKIIFAVRDPRDVVLSCFRRSFNMNASMYQFNSIEGAARYYAAVMESGAVYMESLPAAVFRLRYEDLVADFSGTVKELCAFLDIEWTERLRQFADTAATRRIATPSSTQVGRGLYDDGVNQWRRYAGALEPVLPILRPWIDAFGYDAG